MAYRKGKRSVRETEGLGLAMRGLEEYPLKNKSTLYLPKIN